MNLFSEKIESHLSQVQSRLSSEPSMIVPFEREYPSGHLMQCHRHTRAQLIYAVQGVMRIDTSEGIWVVPPLRAVWVPAGIDHEVRALTALQLRTLYIGCEVPYAVPRKCCVIEVSPLLRELILRLVKLDTEGRQADPAMVKVTLSEISEFNVLPLQIAMPSDPRLLKVCHKILDDPSNTKTCAQWGSEVGASARTLERLFLKETGLCFSAWRRQIRLLVALDHLASGASIASVAEDLGYQSSSAFSAMFKRTLGRLPSEIYN